MQRKKNFEDFEAMFGSSETKRPEIPANGSEVFEETTEVHGTKGTQRLNAEERYKIREQKLMEQAKKRRENRHMGGKILSIVQFILSLVLMCMVFKMDILPMKYLIVVGIVFILLFMLTFALQFHRKGHVFGKGLSIVFSIIFMVANVFVVRTMGMLNDVTQVKTYQIDKVVIAVMAENPAQTVEDMKDYNFGIMTGLDRTKVDQVIDQINEGMDTEIQTTEYTSYTDLVQDLYAEKVDAMIYNQTLDEIIEENNEGFLEKIRVIDNFEIQTEVFMKDIPDLPITKEPFVIFLSGMDVYGKLEQTSRSDVNIMACVHPETKQVLLVSVPRDAYVEIPGVTDGAKDKLTHAGMYGIQHSIAAMEQIFDTEIDYYVRVNFTALINMVDALGGIDVESDYAFSTYYKQYDAATDTWCYYEYEKGMNHLNGIYALAFARERMNAAGGDYQRARNQQKVIAALLEKIKSPAVLKGYSNLLSSLSGTMDTSLSSQQIASLVKMQLNDNADWNIVSSSVYGYASEEYCASYAGAPLSVEILDDDSIEAVKEVIAKLKAGETISEPRVTDIQEMYTQATTDEDDDYYVNNHASDYEYDDFYWEKGGYLVDAENKRYVETESETETESE